MSQRIFDMENEQDVKDLFDLFPEHINRIARLDSDPWTCGILGGKHTKMAYGLKIKWWNKASVDRPVDKSKWIGCLCWMWNDNEKSARLRILESIGEDKNFPFEADDEFFKHCRPATKDGIKFVEDR